MTRFYILRHGETEWNSDHNRYCGKSDIPLSTVGKNQSQKAADFLKNVSLNIIYSSPLKRAQETAKPISQIHSLPIHTDARISEIDFGEWEGQTKREISREYPEIWERWLADPVNVKAGRSGETALQVFERCNDFFQAKIRQHPNDNVLVVSHNTTNRIFMAGSLSMPLRLYRKLFQSNTGISILELSADDMKWLQMNNTSHLNQISF